MVTVGLPTGFTSDAALTLLQTLRTVASDNDRFLSAKLTSVAAHVHSGARPARGSALSADAMFSILGAVAASRGELVSVVDADAAREVAEEDRRSGVSDDLLVQFGATATAVLRTEGAQASGASGNMLPDGTAAQVSVTTASLRFSGRQVEADSTAAYIYRFAQNYVRDNALSSKDISEILYGGGSIGDRATSVARSFKDVIDQLYGFAAGDTGMASSVASWLAAGRPPSSMLHFDGESDEQVVDFIAGLDRDAERLDRQASAMAAAFDRGAMTFEKATEVRGLDYSETVRMYAFAGASGARGTTTMNTDFLERAADGRQHTLLRVGDVELYASW